MPSTIQISQRGFVRSSFCEKMRPQRRFSCRSSPGRVPNVIEDVERRIVHPDRMPLEGDVGEPLPVARDVMEDRLDVGANAFGVESAVGRRERRAVEDEHRAHVHVAVLVFDLEERRIERREPLVMTHRATAGGAYRDLRPSCQRFLRASSESTGYIAT
jgi:hypothetical protein